MEVAKYARNEYFDPHDDIHEPDIHDYRTESVREGYPNRNWNLTDEWADGGDEVEHEEASKNVS